MMPTRCKEIEKLSAVDQRRHEECLSRKWLSERMRATQKGLSLIEIL